MASGAMTVVGHGEVSVRTQWLLSEKDVRGEKAERSQSLPITI